MFSDGGIISNRLVEVSTVGIALHSEHILFCRLEVVTESADRTEYIHCAGRCLQWRPQPGGYCSVVDRAVYAGVTRQSQRRRVECSRTVESSVFRRRRPLLQGLL